MDKDSLSQSSTQGNHVISGKIFEKLSRFPRSGIFYPTLEAIAADEKEKVKDQKEQEGGKG